MVRKLKGVATQKLEDVVSQQVIDAAGICLASLPVERNFAVELGQAELNAIIKLIARIYRCPL